MRYSPTRKRRRVTVVNWMMIVLGAVFLVGGLFMSTRVSLATQVSCERDSGACTITWNRLVGASAETVDIDAIEGAEVRGGDTVRAVVQTREGRINLTSARTSNRGPHERVAQDVNAFLDTPGAARLETTLQDPLGAALFLFPIAGAVLLFGLKNIVTLEVLPERRELRVRRRRCLPVGERTERVPLEQVAGVVLDTTYSKGRRYYRVEIQRLSGVHVPLFSSYSGGSGVHRRLARVRALLEPYTGKDA